MLETFEVSKVLIIAPLRVARDTWPTEIEKWDHLQGLDISVIVGDTKDPHCSTPPSGNDLCHQPGKYQVAGGVL